jgi:dTDP-glucose 4,6-dehydratase
MVPDRPGHDRRYSVDCRKVERELGFTPGMVLEDGLSLTISWFLRNESWWRDVMDGTYLKWMREQYGMPA